FGAGVALKDSMANRLAQETSPYLLQHADNPVEWYPWGPEAMEKSKREDKPMLLSIGYAACHWCHVMAHESFEDEETARAMNENFVNIKVDREERPDIDGIYMQAVQAMTGHGGWPMTVFLLPDGRPFYGGTYFPPADRPGLPSFRKVLASVADAYISQREGVEASAAELTQIYQPNLLSSRSTSPLTPLLLEQAYRGIAKSYDVVNGGLGKAPKFPSTMALDFLLRYATRTGTAYALEMVTKSFQKMARGGIYDQIGGGFARYTVDAIWLVPHFEKMLYDNALLTRLGAHLWQLTRDEEVRRVTTETVEWLAREMTSPEGGFYSSLDADSEGHEGKFYVWTEEEIDTVLGDDSRIFKSYYGVTRGGNFEGKNILFVNANAEMTAARAGTSVREVEAVLRRAKTALYEHRTKRIWPGRDEKILASWNGLMLRGVATAARIFGRKDFADLAVRNAEFLAREMVREGRVMRSHKEGASRIAGFLEDHAAVALGFLAVYELTFDEAWIDCAQEISDAMIQRFWDSEVGAFFDTASDGEQLITRPRDVTDNAVPSGTSLAVELLLRLSELEHDADYRRRATFTMESLAETMTKFPTAFGNLLGCVDMEVFGAVQVALVGSAHDLAFEGLERIVAGQYVPSLVLAAGEPGSTGKAKLLADKTKIDGKATAYVCRGYVCDAPTTDPATLSAQLSVAGKVPVNV
ncbi:MAG TPA: thioredoxin domain-containing protein, partial [Gemmatimonadaceae bacterium]|nr:thioredoxin domain-containing protein [Gemmatimonadaceae bacterium]